MSIRILITDDHGVVREGLGVLLQNEAGVEVVGVAANTEEAMSKLEEVAPDLVLMDISVPQMGGIEATRRIKERAPDVRVLILTVHEDKALLREAMHAGAGGYLLKQAIKSELMHAIHSVMRGDLYLHPVMAGKLMDDLLQQRDAQPAPDTAAPALTPREKEVLRLLAQGYTNRQVAEELGISVRTAEYHRANLSDKVQASGRVALMKYAEEHGLI
jgi:two-component system response regulator NreC